MSKQVDKVLFWLSMAIISLVIAFLTYFTFFSRGTPSSEISKTQETPLTPKQVQYLYVCEDGAAIKELPKKTGKVIRTIRKGEKVAVLVDEVETSPKSEKEEWVQLRQKDKKIAWIEKKFLCSQFSESEAKVEPPKEEQPKEAPPAKKEKPKPEKKHTDNPPPALPAYPDPIQEPYQDTGDPQNNTDAMIEGLFSRINSRTQMQYGQVLFNDYQLLDGGLRLEARATSIWKSMPQPYKAQVLQVLANQYTLIACNIGKIVNCTPENTPGISIVDSSGREVAYQNTRGSQILE